MPLTIDQMKQIQAEISNENEQAKLTNEELFALESILNLAYSDQNKKGLSFDDIKNFINICGIENTQKISKCINYASIIRQYFPTKHLAATDIEILFSFLLQSNIIITVKEKEIVLNFCSLLLLTRFQIYFNRHKDKSLIIGEESGVWEYGSSDQKAASLLADRDLLVDMDEDDPIEVRILFKIFNDLSQFMTQLLRFKGIENDFNLNLTNNNYPRGKFDKQISFKNLNGLLQQAFKSTVADTQVSLKEILSKWFVDVKLKNDSSNSLVSMSDNNMAMEEEVSISTQSASSSSIGTLSYKPVFIDFFTVCKTSNIDINGEFDDQGLKIVVGKIAPLSSDTVLTCHAKKILTTLSNFISIVLLLEFMKTLRSDNSTDQMQDSADRDEQLLPKFESGNTTAFYKHLLSFVTDASKPEITLKSIIKKLTAHWVCNDSFLGEEYSFTIPNIVLNKIPNDMLLHLQKAIDELPTFFERQNEFENLQQMSSTELLAKLFKNRQQLVLVRKISFTEQDFAKHEVDFTRVEQEITVLPTTGLMPGDDCIRTYDMLKDCAGIGSIRTTEVACLSKPGYTHQLIGSNLISQFPFGLKSKLKAEGGKIRTSSGFINYLRRKHFKLKHEIPDATGKQYLKTLMIRYIQSVNADHINQPLTDATKQSVRTFIQEQLTITASNQTALVEEAFVSDYVDFHLHLFDTLAKKAIQDNKSLKDTLVSREQYNKLTKRKLMQQQTYWMQTARQSGTVDSEIYYRAAAKGSITSLPTTYSHASNEVLAMGLTNTKSIDVYPLTDDPSIYELIDLILHQRYGNVHFVLAEVCEYDKLNEHGHPKPNLKGILQTHIIHEYLNAAHKNKDEKFHIPMVIYNAGQLIPLEPQAFYKVYYDPMQESIEYFLKESGLGKLDPNDLPRQLAALVTKHGPNLEIVKPWNKPAIAQDTGIIFENTMTINPDNNAESVDSYLLQVKKMYTDAIRDKLRAMQKRFSNTTLHFVIHFNIPGSYNYFPAVTANTIRLHLPQDEDDLEELLDNVSDFLRTDIKNAGKAYIKSHSKAFFDWKNWYKQMTLRIVTKIVDRTPKFTPHSQQIMPLSSSSSSSFSTIGMGLQPPPSSVVKPMSNAPSPAPQPRILAPRKLIAIPGKKPNDVLLDSLQFSFDTPQDQQRQAVQKALQDIMTNYEAELKLYLEESVEAVNLGKRARKGAKPITRVTAIPRCLTLMLFPLHSLLFLSTFQSNTQKRLMLALGPFTVNQVIYVNAELEKDNMQAGVLYIYLKGGNYIANWILNDQLVSESLPENQVPQLLKAKYIPGTSCNFLLDIIPWIQHFAYYKSFVTHTTNRVMTLLENKVPTVRKDDSEQFGLMFYLNNNPPPENEPNAEYSEHSVFSSEGIGSGSSLAVKYQGILRKKMGQFIQTCERHLKSKDNKRLTVSIYVYWQDEADLNSQKKVVHHAEHTIEIAFPAPNPDRVWSDHFAKILGKGVVIDPLFDSKDNRELEQFTFDATISVKPLVAPQPMLSMVSQSVAPAQMLSLSSAPSLQASSSSSSSSSSSTSAINNNPATFFRSPGVNAKRTHATATATPPPHDADDYNKHKKARNNK